MTQVWTILANVGTFIATVLVTPFLLIATAIFYYDLRVRKEAFDLQVMMSSGAAVTAASSVPSMLS